MQKLVIQNVDEELLRKLQRQAVEHGVTVEEEHLRILTAALQLQPENTGTGRRLSLAEFLLADGDPWPDDFIPPRSKDTNAHRRIEF